MLSLLLPMRQKRNAFQSTTIFRLPTPRKPPKSMTAARTWPARSTTTSTIRPMSSSARDATADNDTKTIIVNANGRLARIWPPVHRRGISSACSPGEPGAASRRRLEPDGPRVPTGIGNQSSTLPRSAVSPRSMRENYRHLNLAARTQNFQRHVIAVATDPQIDARRTQLQFAQDHFVKEYWQA